MCYLGFFFLKKKDKNLVNSFSNIGKVENWQATEYINWCDLKIHVIQFGGVGFFH